MSAVTYAAFKGDLSARGSQQRISVTLASTYGANSLLESNQKPGVGTAVHLFPCQGSKRAQFTKMSLRCVLMGARGKAQKGQCGALEF